jgi:hypothetical protein
MTPKPPESGPVPGRCARRGSFLLGRARISPSRGKEYRVTTPLFMRNAESDPGNRTRRARLPLHFAALSRSGLDANRSLEPEKYSGSRYYPEIAPFSPQFVRTMFYSSHTMMEATKWCGLIASSEARIVDSRQASNRLSEKTQSAARGGSKDRKQLTNEIGARRALRPLGTVAGYDRWWIANFVDCGLQGVTLGVVCRPDDGVACVWSSRPRLRGGRIKAGRSGSTKQRRGIRHGVL